MAKGGGETLDQKWCLCFCLVEKGAFRAHLVCGRPHEYSRGHVYSVGDAPALEIDLTRDDRRRCVLAFPPQGVFDCDKVWRLDAPHCRVFGATPGDGRKADDQFLHRGPRGFSSSRRGRGGVAGMPRTVTR